MSEVNQPVGQQPVEGEKAVVSSSKGNPKIFMALGLVVLVLLGVVGAGVYRAYAKLASDKFTMKIAEVLNLPAAKVGENSVPYVDFVEDLKAIRTVRDFDKAQEAITGQAGPNAGLTDEQMPQEVIRRLVSNLLSGEAAKKYELAVEDEDIKEVKDKLLAQFQDEAGLDAELIQHYGWNYANFETKVIRPFILQRKLLDKLQEPVKAGAEKALEEVKSGADFAVLAKQNNPDSTAEIGGDLGWFGKGRMLPEFEKAAFSLKKGEVYPTLVETRFGYHIIRLDDRRVGKVENDKGKMVNENQVRASHILFAFEKLENFFEEEVKNNKPKIYLRIQDPFEVKAEITTEPVQK